MCPFLQGGGVQRGVCDTKSDISDGCRHRVRLAAGGTGAWSSTTPEPCLGWGAFPAQGLGTETSLQGWVLGGLVHRAGGAKLHLELLLHLGSGGTRPGPVQWGRQELAAPASHGSGKTHQAQEIHWSLQAVKLV